MGENDTIRTAVEPTDDPCKGLCKQTTKIWRWLAQRRQATLAQPFLAAFIGFLFMLGSVLQYRGIDADDASSLQWRGEHAPNIELTPMADIEKTFTLQMLQGKLRRFAIAQCFDENSLGNNQLTLFAVKVQQHSDTG
jgi:hypothetical protein